MKNITGAIKLLRTVLLLVFSISLFPFMGACGGNTAGNTGDTTLTYVQGEVLVKKASSTEWVEGKVGTVLAVGDTIKAGNSADTKVTFFEGSTVELKANTQIEFKELTPGKTTGIKLKQAIGETLSTVKQLADPASRYEIETPSAVAAVRGSQMLVNVAIDGTTIVKNLAGHINISAQGVEVTIPVGYISTVRPGQPPSNPVIPTATDDFSTTSGNPNGTWSYGWMPSNFSTFNLYTTHNSYQWYGPQGGDRTPCIWINNSGTAYGVPTGWLSLHPGPSTEPSVLRWTAPIAGNIHVTGQFLTGDDGIMKVAVRHKNEMIWTATDSGSFDLETKVATGETIDFVVYGGYGFGNTPISATIVYGN